MIDIQNSITKLLYKNFPTHKILAEYNEEGIQGPAFYVSVRPLITEGRLKHKNRLINVDVMYFSKNETHKENLEMISPLEDLFHLILRVEDRRLYIENLSIREADSVLTCSFTLDYNIGLVPNSSVQIPGTGDTVMDPETGEPIVIPGTEEREDIIIDESDKDLGYIDGNIEYMEELHAKDLEGNDI